MHVVDMLVVRINYRLAPSYPTTYMRESRTLSPWMRAWARADLLRFEMSRLLTGISFGHEIISDCRQVWVQQIVFMFI